jgi:3-oxoadipate enol-lactonase
VRLRRPCGSSAPKRASTTCSTAPARTSSGCPAELSEAVCDPPVALVGLSLGGAIVQQVAIDHPDLLRCVVTMGTGARSTGWGWDYQKAEIDWRKAGGRLDGMMAVVHNAAMMFPARVLGNRELWPKLRADLESWLSTDDNERSLIPQWEACLLYDQMAALPACTVPMHVIAFSEDVQAPAAGRRRGGGHRGGGRVPRVRGHGPLLDLRAHARHPEPVHPRRRAPVSVATPDHEAGGPPL